jgi:hypothetical protein
MPGQSPPEDRIPIFIRKSIYNGKGKEITDRMSTFAGNSLKKAWIF